jgi:hypothetical protein
VGEIEMLENMFWKKKSNNVGKRKEFPVDTKKKRDVKLSKW